MKKSDVFPSKYLKCEDLNGNPITVTIERAPLETLKSPDGKEQTKIVLYFQGARKSLPLNITNFDAVSDIAGDDTDDWPGHAIELYPSEAQLGSKMVPCIRVRAPAQRELPTPKKAPKPPAVSEIDDEIPF